MTPGEWADIGISILGIILIPFLALLFRLTIKSTQLVDRVANIDQGLKEAVQNQTKQNAELNAQMRDDRLATNQRLRWLEENLWRRDGERNSKS